MIQVIRSAPGGRPGLRAPAERPDASHQQANPRSRYPRAAGGTTIGAHPPYPPPPLDADRLARLTAYVNRFREVIPRGDQRGRLELYLRGLLDGAEPKNAEAIASRWAGAAGGSGTAQSLQHFLGVSPWDAARFLACYRSLLGAGRGHQSRAWVMQEVVFPKKGRHSVGTQRQFARPVGRKINCQVAVAVSEVSPAGFVPLAIRLYLPGYWLREHQDHAERLVPPEHREHLTKPDIALRLIDDLRDAGRIPDFLTADPVLLSSLGLAEAIAERGMRVILPGDESTAGDSEGEAALAGASLAVAEEGLAGLKGYLGLDQYEGRNWLGWHHHAAAVFAAYGFLVAEPVT